MKILVCFREGWGSFFMTDKRKILFLQKTNKFAGAENIVITLMKLLSSKFEVYYVSPQGPIQEKVENAGLNYVSLPSLSVKSVKSVINQISPDIIHATDYSMSALAGIFINDIPVLSHLHNDPTWITHPLSPRTIVYTLALPKIQKVVAVSRSIENEFYYKKNLKNKIVVIPNVVDLKRVIRLSQSDKPNNLSKKNFDLIFVGRLAYQKNPILFCKIVKEIKNKKKDVQAIMVGDGELREKVAEYILDNNLSNNITMTGYQENPYPFFNHSKIYVLPSRFEGFGLSAVEAMTLGKPVVCGNVGGLKDVVTEKSGHLCNVFTDYVNEITKLLEDSNYYKIKADNAKKQASKFGNLDNYCEKFINIYNEMLAKK